MDWPPATLHVIFYGSGGIIAGSIPFFLIFKNKLAYVYFIKLVLAITGKPCISLRTSWCYQKSLTSYIGHCFPWTTITQHHMSMKYTPSDACGSFIYELQRRALVTEYEYIHLHHQWVSSRKILHWECSHYQIYHEHVQKVLYCWEISWVNRWYWK